MISAYRSSKCMLNVLLVASLVSLLLATSVNANDESSNQNFKALNELREILKHRRSLGYIKNMVDTLMNDINDMHKRACLVGGGMFHGCDYKDILEGTRDQNHYAFRAPGRKRRSLRQFAPSTPSSSASNSPLKNLFRSTRK